MAASASAGRRPRYLAILIVATVCAAAGLISAWAARAEYPLDLRIYMLGGHTTWTGSSLYGSSVHIRQYGFTYPPFAAWIFALPSRLPVGVAFALMTCLSVLCVGVVIHLSDRSLVRRIVHDRSAAALGLVLTMLAFEPVRTNLFDGQINIVLAALVLIDLRAGVGRRGLLTGLAAAIKLTPALFIVYLCLRRRFGDAARAVGVFVAASGIALLFSPHDSVTYWTSQIFNGTGIGDLASTRNHALNGLLRRLIPQHAAVLWALSAIIVAAIGLIVAVRISLTGREPFALGLVGLTACLISPVSWSHHWIWFIPCFAGLAAFSRQRHRLTSARTLLMAGYLVGIAAVPLGALSGDRPIRMVNTYTYLAIGAATLAFAYVHTKNISRSTEPSCRQSDQQENPAHPVHPAARR